MASSNKPQILLLPDVWTLVAPVGFQSITVQVLAPSIVMFATGAAAPTISQSGVDNSGFRDPHAPNTISDTDVTHGLWCRPVTPGRSATMQVN
jgi:hypothetical protein